MADAPHPKIQPPGADLSGGGGVGFGGGFGGLVSSRWTAPPSLPKTMSACHSNMGAFPRNHYNELDFSPFCPADMSTKPIW